MCHLWAEKNKKESADEFQTQGRLRSHAFTMTVLSLRAEKIYSCVV